MKKVVFGLCAFAIFSLASCGEKLLTDAEVQQQIQAKYDLAKVAVESEMDAKCQADFDARVTAEAQRIVEDANTMKAQEAQAAKEAAAAQKGKKK